MKLDEYQEKASKTAIYPKNYELIYPALGLAGEAGEVANKVKKFIRDGADQETFELKKVEIAKELGDVLWYIAALSNDLGVKLSALAAGNLDKLEDRMKRNAISGDGDNR
jgi:NTP pyrophosphatase (non-canonical NTP hydrolase)